MELVTSRAVIGRFFRTLESDIGSSWIGGLSMEFQSDQSSETYPWLGQVPAMREWLGGRHAKGLIENGIVIANKHYEATLEVAVKDLRRDKTGQLNVRIDEFAARANTHWASLLSTLTVNGESVVCYDGQFFFDTDHAEGESGTQSNDLAIDISTLPTASHGSVTQPSVGEMALSILTAIQALQGFKDERGEPMNELARKFLVMVPTSLFGVAVAATTLNMVDNGNANVLASAPGFEIEVAGNARLPWTDKFAVFRLDGRVKPFIRQQETPVDLKVQGEGSFQEFTYDSWLFGLDTWRNVGYGFWQHAVLVTMT